MMNDCNCKKSFTVSEYPCSRPACIRNKQPDCMAKAVIPAITVDNADGITELANCFVHVTSINSTFYIDDKHRIMYVWAGPVEADNYDIANNPLGLRSQECYNKTDGKEQLVYFDKQGIGHIIGTEA